MVRRGSDECVSEVWKLEAEPGQQLNINIIDFAWNKHSNVTCPALYGHVINTLTNQRTAVCGQGQRIKSIYTSDHHVVQLELKNTNNYFIIQVEGKFTLTSSTTTTRAVDIKIQTKFAYICIAVGFLSSRWLSRYSGSTWCLGTSSRQRGSDWL